NNYYFYDIIQDKPYYINKAYLEFTNFEITKKNIVNLENIITLKYLKNDDFEKSENTKDYNLNNEGKFNKSELFLMNFLQNNFNFINIDSIKGNKNVN
uniref:hypothetical protein n=1 Tax=Silvanigrella sp. TaxID=2024976 RepID=UPI0037C7DF1A